MNFLVLEKITGNRFEDFLVLGEISGVESFFCDQMRKIVSFELVL